MEDKSFKSIEDKLKNYFRKTKEMTIKNKQIELLKNHITKIEQNIKTNNICIPEESSSPQFGERVQTSPSGMSYAEKTMYQIVERMTEEKANKIKEISRLEEDIRTIDADASLIGAVIENNKHIFTEENYKILRLKYELNYPNWKIGNNVKMHTATVYRQIDRLLAEIKKYL